MRIASKLRREDGASAVEFALIAPVFIVLLFGMLEFGLAMFTTYNLRAAVREGGRQSAVENTTADPNVIGDVQDAVIRNFAGLPRGAIQVTPCDGETKNQNTTVTITTNPYPTSGVATSLTIAIPLLPTWNLHPQITSVFRCEQ